MYQYVLVCTDKDLVSKMLKTGFEPAIFCMTYACATAALRGYTHYAADMLHLESLGLYSKICVPACFVPGS